MTAVELLPPGEAVHGNDRWYELRRQGITASEIAVVLGISPYGSPFSLYWQKVNDWRDEGNVYTSVGRHLEDAIADWFMAVQDPLENMEASRAGLYAHVERSWQLATPDRLLHPRCMCCSDGMCSCGLYGNCSDCMNTGLGGPAYAVLECKWVAYSWDGWGADGSDDIPAYYRAQVLWQCDVLDVDEWFLAALGPGGFRAYHGQRDENDLKVMRDAGAEFARRLAEEDPPPLDSHTATLDTLKRLHPTVGDGDTEVGETLARQYAEARAIRADGQEAVDLCEAQIRDALGSTYARATHDGKLVASRSVFEQQRIDSKRLRVEQPDIAAEYTLATLVDRLNPGRTPHA